MAILLIPTQHFLTSAWIILFGFLLTASLFGQENENLVYPRYVLEKLCAPEMSGRAYTNQGEKKAADFIASEYEKLGVHPIGDSYFQKFTVNSNIFSDKMKIRIGNKSLVPGQDYLVSSESTGRSGRFEYVHLNPSIITDIDAFIKWVENQNEKFIIIDESDFNLSVSDQRQAYEAITHNLICADWPGLTITGLIVLTEDKLTWSPSPILCRGLLIKMKKSVFDPSITKIKVRIENDFRQDIPSQNVVGVIPGKSQPDSLVFIIAHYDHLGTMGKKTYFPGANDNASGVAMLLSLAAHFKKEENRLDKSIVFIAFGAEEIGLKGSIYYTEKPMLPLANINFLINLDILGTGDDGIQVVNGSVYGDKFEDLKALNAKSDLLKEVKIRGRMCKSDHCFFDQLGVPCFYIYTLGGVAFYHDIYDKPDTLPLTEFDDLKLLLIKFIQSLDKGNTRKSSQ